jgi:hypothetical protein
MNFSYTFLKLDKEEVGFLIIAGLHLGWGASPPPLADLLPPALQICCLPKLVSQHMH